MLAAAAFGAEPGIAAADLPIASSATEHWHRAVVLGGQGRYAAARAELSRIDSTDPVLHSLAHSTAGSLLRQLGWHARAAVANGRAVALILPTADRSGASDAAATGPDRTDALCDALTGLAADALGTGRLTLAARLLQRSRTVSNPATANWRVRIRWHWVSAETALAGGAPALADAEAALALAEQAPSVRHRVKSRLLVAAAAAGAGDRDRALALAETVAAQCREHGLLPLRWASAMLRAGLADSAAASAEAEACAETIARRGGCFHPAGSR